MYLVRQGGRGGRLYEGVRAGSLNEHYPITAHVPDPYSVIELSKIFAPLNLLKTIDQCSH